MLPLVHRIQPYRNNKLIRFLGSDRTLPLKLYHLERSLLCSLTKIKHFGLELVKTPDTSPQEFLELLAPPQT